MDLFIKHKLIETEEGTTIILYMNPGLVEFARELGDQESSTGNQHIKAEVYQYIRRKIRPGVQAKIAKIMFGSVLIATFAMNEQASQTFAAENPNTSYSQQSNDIKVIIDGQQLSFSQNPMIINGSTYIPIRDVAEAYGATVWWNGQSKTVGINKDNTQIAFTVGATAARVNGEQVVVPPSIQIDDTVMVPVRFVSQTFGLQVDWNDAHRTITITSPQTFYTVVAGDTLWGLSQKYGISVNKLKQTNQLTSDVLKIGQALKIPGETKQQTIVNQTANSANPTKPAKQVGTTYQVVRGDTLFSIANRFNTTVNQLKQENNLANDTIYVGQMLTISSNRNGSSTSAPHQNTGTKSISYSTHTIQKGDNMWDLSVKYGIPMSELLKVNGMTQNSPLSIGQKIQVPVHHIPVQKTVSAKHGEFLDWWTEAQYLFTINKVAKVTDLQTGKTFMVKRTTGANHADNEPLTANDAAIIKQVWGGTYSWKTRPVTVEVDGRKIAASMSSMPHDVQYITNNNFNGHFDIHFKNSTRHKDGLVDNDHQAKIKIAAGLQ